MAVLLIKWVYRKVWTDYPEG